MNNKIIFLFLVLFFPVLILGEGIKFSLRHIPVYNPLANVATGWNLQLEGTLGNEQQLLIEVKWVDAINKTEKKESFKLMPTLSQTQLWTFVTSDKIGSYFRFDVFIDGENPVVEQLLDDYGTYFAKKRNLPAYFIAISPSNQVLNEKIQLPEETEILIPQKITGTIQNNTSDEILLQVIANNHRQYDAKKWKKLLTFANRNNNRERIDYGCYLSLKIIDVAENSLTENVVQAGRQMQNKTGNASMFKDGKVE